MKHSLSANHWRLTGLFVGILAGLVGGGDVSLATTPPIPISIYQAPLTVAIPSHPQVVIAVGNSESMDGNLTGAILTGSGSLPSTLSELQSTAVPSPAIAVSPVNFQVPAGFTPPISGGAVGSMQPYTVQVNGNFADNSPSRMNLAKIGLMTVITNFVANTDFALIDYATATPTSAPTWVYYMSPVGQNFSVADTVPAGQRGVPNPCYQVPFTSDAISTACLSMAAVINGGGITAHPWLLVGASSDDAAINDVFYDLGNGTIPLCVVYSGPSHANPYTFFSLANYESAGISESYGSAKGDAGFCPTATGPTNAGYVPFSQQVMYVKRGFSYWTSSETSNSGFLAVPMTSSGAVPDFTPVTGSVAKMLAKFAPLLNPETNNASTPEIKAAATQSPTAGLLAKALNYFATGTFTATNSCAPTRYVVLVTDGLPTRDLAGNNWPPLGSAAALPSPNGYGAKSRRSTS